MSGSVCIIGCGYISGIHIEAYRSYSEAVELSLCDTDMEKARPLGEGYGIQRYFQDYGEVLERDDIEAVDVCLHNNLHRPVTVAALEAGKHVYCEKPMAGAYKDAEVMFETAEKLGLKLAIQLRTVFSNETKAAKSLIDEGRLGNIYHARSTGFRRRGRPYVDGYGTPAFVQKATASGGALYDMGVYHIGNMLYLLGMPEVLRVSGKIYQETPMDSKRREISGYDVEELGLGLVRLENGITLDIIEAWAIHLKEFEGSYIVGSEGGIQLEPFGYYHNIGDLDINAVADMNRFDWRLHNVREDGDAYDSPQCHWVAALQGRVPLLPTAEIALKTMLISEAIFLSDELGREVTADEVREASQSTSIQV